MKIGSKVKLISFNGAFKADDDCIPSENYWKLINFTGKIVQDPNKEGMYSHTFGKPRLLVQFEEDVISLGLECHNNIENSLWLLETDLIEIEAT
jgi:hypothetical protein